jgi:UPF0176 protein
MMPVTNSMKKVCIPRSILKEKIASENIPRVTLSFYKYVRIKNPARMREVLVRELGALGCLGRIYLASEGINAQMNVPKANWEKFDACVQAIPEFKGIPYKIAVEETDAVSFYKLTIKVKDKIVADGLDDASFDVTKTGEYLSAEEMNAYIDDPEAIVVDMRNGYESEVGRFDNAITPDVDTFREELKVVPEMLRVHKNKKIVLYCTGGIRCEKASAWLRHNGFSDVKHLKGGIIDYKRQVEEKKLPNRFKGKNFVFDERMGERISEEIISHCHLCSTEKSDTHIHCKNQACHVLFLCCDTCKAKKKGYCSYKCMTFDILPASVKKRLTRNNHKKKLEQFKKHRLKSVIR